MSGVAVRHADASGGNIIENQHEEDRMRDIHIGRSGPEVAGEEQHDKSECSSVFRSDCYSGISCERRDTKSVVHVQTSGHVDDDVQISALDPLYEMDGRKSRYIREALEWYRGEDARDLKRSELNELVVNLTCLNELEGKIWKSDQVVMDDKNNQKVVMDDKINQKIVMDEELVQNDMDEKLIQDDVMDGQFVKNFVMDAKIDPMVVMDQSILKIGGWNSLRPINHNSLEELIDKNEVWLLIGIPRRDPFLVTQYLKRLTESSDQHMR